MTNLQTAPILKIDRGTLIPIGLLITVVMAAITATVWINTYLVTLTQKVDSVRVQVEKLNDGAWTSSDMAAWVALAKALNAGKIEFPEPKVLR